MNTIYSIYEGILDDIDTGVSNMDKDMNIALNFPDKNRPNALYYGRNGEIRWDWYYPAAVHTKTVKEFCDSDKIWFTPRYNEFDDHRGIKISVRVLPKGNTHRWISIGLANLTSFWPIGASIEFKGSKKAAIDYAYEILEIIRDNPKMIDWIIEQTLEFHKTNRMNTLVHEYSVFNEAMNKFKKK
jgi:hypothetical protein